ncbi:MAG: DUF4296 domain-containing protein [Bacteroidales bacterium]|nr:DUF4296 domain-containing protein [Bacteroidales bacterium]
MVISKKPIYISLTIGSLLGIGTCSQQPDEAILTRNKMAEVLYDYHLAQAIAKHQQASDTLSQEDYANMVLAKHGISQATFDTSLLWYSRNNEEFYEIYNTINERLDQRLGTSFNHSSEIATFATFGDTANIWTGRSVYWLSPSSYNNTLHFTLSTDTTLHSQDKIEWRFNSDFIYSSGNKSAIVLLAIRYDNDSIATSVNRIYGNGQQLLTLIVGNRPTKEVYGHVYLDEAIDNSNKLCLISNLALVRYKHQALPNSGIALPDSAADSLTKDSSTQIATDSI